LGIGLIPEDRKTEGAFLEHSIEWNITCMCLKSLSRFTVLQTKKMAKVGEQYIRSLQIKCVSAEQLVKFLSGGNQQKVVLAKVLAAQLEILLFDEPTRGIDVGAKQEIYKLMNELADQGKSIIMISSDMEEIMGMSDRMLVMHEGRIAGELTRERFDQTLILEYASGEAEE
jgi:ABC-type sugar transport system ATPase subunit